MTSFIQALVVYILAAFFVFIFIMVVICDLFNCTLILLMLLHPFLLSTLLHQIRLLTFSRFSILGKGICRLNCRTAHSWCDGECPSTGSSEERSFAIIFDLLHWDCKFSNSLVPIIFCPCPCFQIFLADARLYRTHLFRLSLCRWTFFIWRILCLVLTGVRNTAKTSE
jgi:hypothetical protein